MSFLSPIHIAFFAAVALFVLGPKRFPEFTRAIGNGMREFRAVMSGVSLSGEPASPAVAADAAETPPLVAASVAAGPADAAAVESPQA
jgi:Sec-independent protein translocase protein TatA